MLLCICWLQGLIQKVGIKTVQKRPFKILQGISGVIKPVSLRTARNGNQMLLPMSNHLTQPCRGGLQMGRRHHVANA